jgi:HSP20 family protein
LGRLAAAALDTSGAEPMGPPPLGQGLAGRDDRGAEERKEDHMAELVKRSEREPRSIDVFDRFDRLFDEWTRMLPFRRPSLLSRPFFGEDVIRVEERREKDAVVVRAELPGIDPDKDVQVTISDGMLHIEAERREVEESEKAGYTRRELRYGSFSRTLPLPSGARESEVSATYKDGMLEVRIPTREQAPEHKIPIAKA